MLHGVRIEMDIHKTSEPEQPRDISKDELEATSREAIIGKYKLG